MKSNLPTSSRRYLILEAVSVRGGLSFSAIRELFRKTPVSDPTLRKDINVISRLPAIYKDSRGGLQVRPSSVFSKHYFGVNLSVKPEAKERIAQRVVLGKPAFAGSPLINLHNDAVVVGPGSGALAVLRVLAGFPSVEILTTNLGVLEIPELLLSPSLHFSGGWVLPSVASLVGTAAVRNIDAFGANTAIVGVSGFYMEDKVNRDIWLCCHQEAQLPVKQALVRGRKKVIVVTCGEKLGRRDAHCFCSISQLLLESDLYVFTDYVDKKVYEKLAGCMKDLEASAKKGYKARIIELEQK